MVYKYGFSTPNELNRGNIDLQGLSFFFVQVSQLFQESGIGYTVKIVVVGLVILEGDEVNIN
jgi:hypothetical protein